jgi:hypothetical protein
MNPFLSVLFVTKKKELTANAINVHSITIIWIWVLNIAGFVVFTTINGGHLGCCAVCCTPMFRRNILPPSSALKMETVCLSEMLASTDKVYTAPKPRRSSSSSSPPWEPQISQIDCVRCVWPRSVWMMTFLLSHVSFSYTGRYNRLCIFILPVFLEHYTTLSHVVRVHALRPSAHK